MYDIWGYEDCLYDEYCECVRMNFSQRDMYIRVYGGGNSTDRTAESVSQIPASFPNPSWLGVGKAIPAPKTRPNISMNNNCLMVNKLEFRHLLVFTIPHLLAQRLTSQVCFGQLLDCFTFNQVISVQNITLNLTIPNVRQPDSS